MSPIHMINIIWENKWKILADRVYLKDRILEPLKWILNVMNVQKYFGKKKVLNLRLNYIRAVDWTFFWYDMMTSV